jgi:hypothetical protein
MNLMSGGEMSEEIKSIVFMSQIVVFIPKDINLTPFIVSRAKCCIGQKMRHPPANSKPTNQPPEALIKFLNFQAHQ